MKQLEFLMVRSCKRFIGVIPTHSLMRTIKYLVVWIGGLGKAFDSEWGRYAKVQSKQTTWKEADILVPNTAAEQ